MPISLNYLSKEGPGIANQACGGFSNASFCCNGSKLTTQSNLVSFWLEVHVRGPVSIQRPLFPGMGISMLNIRRSWNRLIFNMGDPPYTGKTTSLYWDCSQVPLFKGFRPVLEGGVVTMHEGVCETGSQISRALAWGIWRTVRTSPNALWQQTPTNWP